MIRAKVIRIGNYCSRTAGFMPITGMHGDDVYFGDGDIEDFKDVMPIILTEEILVALGFTENMYGRKNNNDYSKQGFPVVIGKWATDQYFQMEINGHCFPLYFVHQLQNIYCAILEQELPTRELDKFLNNQKVLTNILDSLEGDEVVGHEPADAEGNPLYEGDRVCTLDWGGGRIFGTLHKNTEHLDVSEWYVKWDDGHDCAVLNFEGLWKAPNTIKKITQ